MRRDAVIALMVLLLGCSARVQEQAETSEPADLCADSELTSYCLWGECDGAIYHDTADALAEAQGDAQAEATMDISTDESPDAPSDVQAETGPDLPHYPDATFLKQPWLQWPQPGRLVVLAETQDETPLELRLDFGTGEKVYYSEPERHPFEVDGVSLPPFDGWLHEVPMTFPEDVAQVTVRVANGGQTLSLPLPQFLDRLDLLVFGDNRSDWESHKLVVDEVLAEHALVVVNTGDLVSYGDDVTIWNRFFEIEGALLSSSWYFAAVGNHDEVGGAGIPYFNSMLYTEGSPDESHGNYAIDLGLAGLVVIDAFTTDWSSPEAQAWLEENLAKLASKPWLFFMAHPPIYTFSYHEPWLEARALIQPLLEEYGVDMVFAGHNHCYEHFLVNGIDYITTGGGGAPLYGLEEGPEDERPLLVTAKTMHNYLNLDVGGDSIEVTVINADSGEVFEQFVLEH